MCDKPDHNSEKASLDAQSMGGREKEGGTLILTWRHRPLGQQAGQSVLIHIGHEGHPSILV